MQLLSSDYFLFLLHSDWDQFKTTFNKTYADNQEETERQKIFLKNKDTIVAHNQLYEQGRETYSLCVNKFADWSADEYLSINGIDSSKIPLVYDDLQADTCDCDCSNSGNGQQDVRSPEEKSDSGTAGIWLKGGKVPKAQSDTESNKTNVVSDSKDWRDEGAVTPVKDQLKCASCWSFSAAGALEGQFFLKNGVLQSLSEQQLIDCSRGYANNGCNTGFMTNAFLYTRKDGILTEEQYPYEAKDDRCRASPNSSKNRKLKSIPKGDEQSLKAAVGQIGPVAVGLDATHDKFMFFSEGVYFNPDCDPERISHAVLAVGYGTDEKTGMDYWIIKNSYGTTWGEDGYGKLARNKDNHCGITNLASYPIL